MKICITGHSKGLGKYLFDYYTPQHTVYGFSRSNGYDLRKSLDPVLETAKNCDLLINNAPADNAQIDLMLKLCNIVPKIVTSGSTASNYPSLLQKKTKNDLEKVSDLISLNPNLSDILLIKLGFLEKPKKYRQFQSDFQISFKEVAETIDFWLEKPKIYKIDFCAKLTPFTINRLENHDAKDPAEFRELLEKVNRIENANSIDDIDLDP